MSYIVYKAIHLTAVMFVFLALGGITVRALGGQTFQDEARRLAGLTHGLALLFVVFSGFGLLARLGIEHDWLFPGWVWTKLGIWLVIAVSPALLRRAAVSARFFWLFFPLLGGLAAILAATKPL